MAASTTGSGRLAGMARISIITGAVLIVLGIVVSIASGSESVTSYIPAFIGLVFVALGVAGVLKPGINRHLMHAAAALALLAILGSLGSLFGRGAQGWALASQLATVVIAAAFLVAAIRSFRAARLARTTQQ